MRKALLLIASNQSKMICRIEFSLSSVTVEFLVFTTHQSSIKTTKIFLSVTMPQNKNFLTSPIIGPIKYILFFRWLIPNTRQCFMSKFDWVLIIMILSTFTFQRFWFLPNILDIRWTSVLTSKVMHGILKYEKSNSEEIF